MSFAFNAAPFSENYSNMDDNKSAIDKKRNKTIKKPIRTTTSTSGSPSPHVEAMMQRIHNSPDDEDNNLEDFNQESPSESSKKSQGQIPQPIQMQMQKNNNNMKDGPVSVEAFTQLPKDSTAADYYQQYIPNYYNQMSEPTSGNRELLEKLNYMIHMLEEQQNEKTGHVTEEVILYSFLGVFIIFVVDSFARAGKYIR